MQVALAKEVAALCNTKGRETRLSARPFDGIYSDVKSTTLTLENARAGFLVLCEVSTSRQAPSKLSRSIIDFPDFPSRLLIDGDTANESVSIPWDSRVLPFALHISVDGDGSVSELVGDAGDGEASLARFDLQFTRFIL